MKSIIICMLRASLAALFAAALLGPWQPALAQFTQQTQALDGNFVDGPNFEQGGYVAISGDGNTALWSGRADSASAGSSWVFVRGGPKGWSQQGVAPLTRENSTWRPAPWRCRVTATRRSWKAERESWSSHAAAGRGPGRPR